MYLEIPGALQLMRNAKDLETVDDTESSSTGVASTFGKACIEFAESQANNLGKAFKDGMEHLGLVIFGTAVVTRAIDWVPYMLKKR